MEIANATTILTCPERNYLIVKLETRDGLVGWGDATLNGREKAVEAALEHHVLPEIEGHDANRTEDVWQRLFRNTYWRGGPVLNTALSGVDMALWDLKGKRAGLPVYDLLGGRTRDYATVYNHCGAPTVDGILENCQPELDRGIDHLRVNVHSAEDTYLDTEELVEGVLAVREELGPEPELIIDVHGRATPAEVTQIAQRLEPADLFFLEDPLRPENKDTFARLRNHTTTPLAMGELFTNPWEMVPLIENEYVDFIRTDLAHVGGITPADKLAAVGEHHYVETAFHAPGDVSPIGQAATVHVDLSVPNFGVQELCEHPVDVGPDVTEVFEGGAFLREGVGGLDVPDEPGLGIDVDEDAAARFEYERSHLPTPRAEDGSVRDW